MNKWLATIDGQFIKVTRTQDLVEGDARFWLTAEEAEDLAEQLTSAVAVLRPTERWATVYGDEFEIQGMFISHNNCGFSWHKDHRAINPEDEECPICPIKLSMTSEPGVE